VKAEQYALVESCGPLYKPKALEPIIPNDRVPNQWGFHNTAVGGSDQAPNFDIDAPEAGRFKRVMLL